MKRLQDYDEYGQSIPKTRKMFSLGSPRVRVPGYVTQEEFINMQDELTKQLEEQSDLLEKSLLELKQIKLHLASLSQEEIAADDVEDD